MVKYIDIKLDSARNVRIDATRLSEGERQIAVSAVRDAELWVDAFMWVGKKIEQLGARLSLKPSPKASFKPSLKH